MRVPDESERLRFAAACADSPDAEAGGIGTLGEKRLHRVLKRYLDPDPAHYEVPVAGSVADIFDGGVITEIQTRSFERLLPRLDRFLPLYPVRVVYPLPYRKTLRWLDPATGELTPARRSPKRWGVHDALFELSKLRRHLANPRLTVRLLFVDVEEYRYLDGWGRDGKRGSTRMERLPLSLEGEVTLGTDGDYRVFLPDPLPDPFTVREFAARTACKSRWAYAAVRLLCERGIVRGAGKRGRENLYTAVAVKVPNPPSGMPEGGPSPL